jgi:hypothetical protein
MLKTKTKERRVPKIDRLDAQREDVHVFIGTESSSHPHLFQHRAPVAMLMASRRRLAGCEAEGIASASADSLIADLCNGAGG